MTACLALLLLAAPAPKEPTYASVEQVLTALRSDLPFHRRSAARFVHNYASTEWVADNKARLVPVLIGLLGDKDIAVRDAALVGLNQWFDANMLPDETKAGFAKALRPLVKERGHPDRAGLAKRLAALDPDDKPVAVAALKDMLDHETDEDRRVAAATGLIDLSPDDKPLGVRALRGVMTAGKSAEPRVAAAEALVAAEPADKPAAVKVCREIARTATNWPVFSAAGALRKFKAIDTEEWVALIAAGLDRSDDVLDRGNMASALGHLGPKRAKTALPALLKVMNGPGEYARIQAAWALLAVDPTREKDVLPVARAGLKDRDISGTAAALLAKLGPIAKDSLPDLRAALKAGPAHDDWGTERVNILTAIGKVDPAGVPEAVDGLREMVRQPKTYMMGWVVNALGKFGPAAGPAVPELIEYARTGAVGVFRIGLAKTFGEIGPAAKAAEPLLKEWAKDEDEDLREAVADALARIAGKGM